MLRTTGGMKRLPYAMQLPSTVWCCCSCIASTHHYSNFNSVILGFLLSFWKLPKKHPHASFQMPAYNLHVYHCIAYKLKKKKKNRQLGVRYIFLASKLDCLGKSFYSVSPFHSLSNLFLYFTNCLVPKSASLNVVRDEEHWRNDLI